MLYAEDMETRKIVDPPCCKNCLWSSSEYYFGIIRKVCKCANSEFYMDDIEDKTTCDKHEYF